MSGLAVFALGGLAGWWKYTMGVVSPKAPAAIVAAVLMVMIVTMSGESVWNQRRDEFRDAQVTLVNHGTVGGVFGDVLEWVCVSPQPDAAKATAGGVPIRSWFRPVVRVRSGDDRTWLWEPRAPRDNGGVTRRAVGYPADSIAVRTVQEDGITPVTPAESCREPSQGQR